MKHGASLIYSFILFIGDFLALVAAFTLAYVIRVKLDDRPLLEPITAGGYIGVVALLLIFWLIIFAILGLYRSQVYENRFKEFLMLVVGSFIGILFLIGCEYVLNRAIFPARLVTAYGFLFALLLSLLFRTIARATKRILFRFNIGINNVLIVGSTDITGELAHRLSQPHLGYRIIGVVGDRRNKIFRVSHDMQFSDFMEATKKIKDHNIHSIVQTELFADQQKNDEILTYAQENHIAYRFVPGNNKLFVGSIEVSLFEDIPTIAVHQTALIGWGRIAKRLFDLFAGMLMLIILSPILILVWLLLSIFGGDAIYKQTRLSRYKSKIGLYKFRSHSKEYHKLSPEQAFEKMKRPELIKQYRENGDFLEDDPRVTRFGKFLRKTSIDELPQLLNVIKGDLSLVGPRPLVPEEMDLSDKKNAILSVKPGITGLAVISGRKNLPFEERRKLDMYYAQNWSFWLDLVILLKTAVQVVARSFSKRTD